MDLNLLAEVSSKIGRRKKGETTSLKREVGDFEWPINELKVLVVESGYEADEDERRSFFERERVERELREEIRERMGG